ncbi:DUF5994 family protein [Streptomyces avermitilis]|uniref:DUF5994 family protein n=1 Tax=Streptomyces avermitilis TaxID=33903 RepID=UPI0033CAFB41
MTATASYPPPTLEDRPASSYSSYLRLSLAPVGPAPALLDGAWWPRSRDLDAELPALTAVLDPLWGRITRVTVNPTYWPAFPHKVPTAPLVRAALTECLRDGNRQPPPGSPSCGEPAAIGAAPTPCSPAPTADRRSAPRAWPSPWSTNSRPMAPNAASRSSTATNARQREPVNGH